jgi:hypothetical protein
MYDVWQETVVSGGGDVSGVRGWLDCLGWGGIGRVVVDVGQCGGSATVAAGT